MRSSLPLLLALFALQVNRVLTSAGTSDALTAAFRELGEKLTEGLVNLGEALSAANRDSCQCGSNEPSTAASCVDVKEYDPSSGVHTLTVNNRNIRVFCDQTTAGGGWTVIQRRVNGQVDFYRNWTEYANGFGDLTHDFWLGLDKIYLLTSSRQHSLRVDLEDWDGSTAYAEYWEFSISGPDDDYRLHASGYSGTAGDSITASGSLQNNNQQFSTPDRDNDPHYSHCARDSRHGAWWYSAVCGYANLNGQYRLNGAMDYGGIMWYSWKSERSLKHVEMKIKPRA